jgi:hypothetical protein
MNIHVTTTAAQPASRPLKQLLESIHANAPFHPYPFEGMLQGESWAVSPLYDVLSWHHTNWRPLEGVVVAPQLQDDPWWQWLHTDWHSPGQMLQGELSEAPPLPDDPWWQHANWDSPGGMLYEGRQQRRKPRSCKMVRHQHRELCSAR